jgi:hypothetical protein
MWQGRLGASGGKNAQRLQISLYPPPAASRLRKTEKKKIKKISRFAGIKKGAKKYGGFAAKKKDVSICQYARERKYIVCILTNGLYFNEVQFFS